MDFNPDHPVWWTMCGNEGGVRFFGPYGSREAAVGYAARCQANTSHHYVELSCRQLCDRLPPMGSVDRATHYVTAFNPKGESVILADFTSPFEPADLARFLKEALTLAPR